MVNLLHWGQRSFGRGCDLALPNLAAAFWTAWVFSRTLIRAFLLVRLEHFKS